MKRWVNLYRYLTNASLLRRLVIFFVTLSILWAPFALVFYSLGYWSGQSHLTNALALIALYGCFIGHAWFWGRWGHSFQKPLQAYGLVLGRQFWWSLLVSLVFGFSLVCALFGIEILLGWASFHPRPLMVIALEGLAIGLGFGFVEELLFRGWLQTELQLSLSRFYAIVWSSFIFATAHFIKPLPDILKTSPQFLGLFLLGLILASSRYMASQRSFPARPCNHHLGLPMGFHGGLIWGYYIVDVGDLVMPSGLVPDWVTGIHGNPLSGALGVAILSGLTFLAWIKLRLK